MVSPEHIVEHSIRRVSATGDIDHRIRFDRDQIDGSGEIIAVRIQCNQFELATASAGERVTARAIYRTVQQDHHGIVRTIRITDADAIAGRQHNRTTVFSYGPQSLTCRIDGAVDRDTAFIGHQSEMMNACGEPLLMADVLLTQPDTTRSRETITEQTAQRSVYRVIRNRAHSQTGCSKLEITAFSSRCKPCCIIDAGEAAHRIHATVFTAERDDAEHAGLTLGQSRADIDRRVVTNIHISGVGDEHHASAITVDGFDTEGLGHTGDVDHGLLSEQQVIASDGIGNIAGLVQGHRARRQHHVTREIHIGR